MSYIGNVVHAAELGSIVAAIGRSMATIQFDLDGTIIEANENFLKTLGYTSRDVVGRKHSMFVDPEYARSSEYREFWAALARGEFQAGEFRRLGRDGKEVWIQASYNPLIGRNGRPYKVIKFAADITEQKRKAADAEGQLSAISRSQAVIQFELDGTIITANQNFLSALGYALADIQGKHHSMFVKADYRNSAAYTEFWAKLRRGEYQAGQFERVGSGGREVWIQASYNPIFNATGKLVKVVKYASDVTAEVMAKRKIEAAKLMIDENLVTIAQAVSGTSDQATSAAAASNQTTSNIQAVAAGAEEMSATVAEIAQSMAKSRQASEEAFGLTEQASTSTNRLASAATAMTGIVEMIQGIAEQINLLSLNATIESARAGEAGRGFAVVATEVKNLAQQASKATLQISDEIKSLQGISNEVNTALETIRKSISLVNESVITTASAVEEQSAVSREISSNMQTAVVGAASVNDSLKKIAAAAADVDQSVREVRDASAALS